MRRKLLLVLFMSLCLPPSVIEAVPAKARLKVGVALSGGGAKGLAHIGVLKVLEEEGIPVDFITGTSMGAIVGGLYALGYDASTLERVIKGQDWTSLLLDQVPRRALSMDEKEYDGTFIGTFPLTKGRISLPKGLVAGQQITLMLTRLTIPFHHVTDFRKLPIPFMCMATDIETGQLVILDHGFLSEAMRASMSIPFVFNPVEIDGRLLVDGGIVRNLPVTDARDMGADIVIGVDVGSTLYTKEQLNSVATIMDQCVSFMKDASTREQQQLADILITPDIEESNSFAFEAVDELVKQGEAAAREKLPLLRELARQVSRGRPVARPEPKAPFDSRRKLAVKSLEFEGLNKVSERLLRGKLRLRIPGRYTVRQIEQAIDRAYGTKFFERLTYSLKPERDGVRLGIKVAEQTSHLFNIGARYDSDQKAAFLLNNTFRNTLFQGAKLTLDARLGRNVRFKGAFFLHTGWKPGIGCGVSLEGSRYDTFTYQNNKRSAHYELRSLEGDLTLQTIFSNSIVLGGGVEKEFTTVKPIISPNQEVKRDNEYLNFYGFLKVDTLDRLVYPRRGGRFYTEFKATTDWLAANTDNKRETFERAFVSYRKAIPLSTRTTFLGHYFLGSIEGDAIPEEYLFYFGGTHEQIKCDFPFIGYDYMQVAGKHAQGLRVGLQFEIKPGRFLILRSNAGKVADTRDEVFNHNGLFYGHGLTLGQNTLIGPMELTLMNSSNDDNLAGYLNVGYIF